MDGLFTSEGGAGIEEDGWGGGDVVVTVLLPVSVHNREEGDKRAPAAVSIGRREGMTVIGLVQVRVAAGSGRRNTG